MKCGYINKLTKDLHICDTDKEILVPNSQTVTTGTLVSGTVADVQTWQDGNIVNVAEVTGVPGFDVLYTFTNVFDFCDIGISAYYVGSSVHWCEVQIFDDTNITWRVLWTFSTGLGFNYRFSDFPDPANLSDYINGSNEVKIRFYHPVSGNASHDLYVDFVSIGGRVLV